MKKDIQLRWIVLSVLAAILTTTSVCFGITYRNTREYVTATLANIPNCENCYHEKTFLSFENIDNPPKLIRLPHWQIHYDCDADSSHGGIWHMRQSEAWSRPTHQ